MNDFIARVSLGGGSCAHVHMGAARAPKAVATRLYGYEVLIRKMQDEV